MGFGRGRDNIATRKPLLGQPYQFIPLGFCTWNDCFVKAHFLYHSPQAVNFTAEAMEENLKSQKGHHITISVLLLQHTLARTCTQRSISVAFSDPHQS